MNKWLPLIALIGIACLALGVYSIFHSPSVSISSTSTVPSIKKSAKTGQCGMKLDAYCQAKFGYDSTSVLVQPDDARTWNCDAKQGTRRLVPIAMDEVCRMQWGASSKAIMDDVKDFESWHCSCP
jgi:hypothetical protein